MSTTKINRIDINKISSFKKLLEQLNSLGEQLPGSELDKLAAFNNAYIVVTNSIKKTLEIDGFDNPKLIGRFTLEFSYYYFQVINDVLAGSDIQTIAWLNLFKKTPGPLPNFIYLLMGANAHINHDLALVMVKMLDNGNQNLQNDIINIDKILSDSGSEILSTFTESKRTPRFIKDRLTYFYLPLTMKLVLHWRIKAWKDCLKIKRSGLNPDRALASGRIISIWLLWLGKILA